MADTLPMVEIEPCPMDLTLTSLRQALAQAGLEAHFTYRIVVHPEMRGWAVETLLQAHEAHFKLETDESLRYVDEWYLYGPKACVHSEGA